MLDNNALSQLKSLKQELHDSIPRFEGRVRATAGRFGFAVTDDNQQYFLSPEEMEKVLPGDRIAFRVEQVDEKKSQALIEKLISTDISHFCGRYIVKGKGHFIEADHPALNRWIFVPPKQRTNIEPGDLVSASLTQHPYPNGKAQCSIDSRIGKEEDNGIENRFMCQKWSLHEDFEESTLAAAETLINEGLESHLTGREDLNDIPFVTIDSASTRDLDDALAAEANENGWLLRVAIADPAALIQPGSELDTAARARATSVYFPYRAIPMLPPQLSEQICSLQAGETRLALVAEIQVQADGHSELLGLKRATITSKGKLSYHHVAQLMEQGESSDIDPALHLPLQQLQQCYQALASYRLQTALVMDDRPDYRLILNEHGKVQEILRQDRNDAQRLVEECMLVCNRHVAEWLAEQESGIFVRHNGVRSERIGDASNLLKETLGLEQKPKFKTLEDYVSVMQQAANHEGDMPLKEILSRQQDRSTFSTECGPHMGLGFRCYTTMTSPLRKYNDLLVHRLITELLTGDSAQVPSQELLNDIQESQSRGRIAANQAEYWLKLQWLAQFPEQSEFEGQVFYANASGITVRLGDFGIDGQVEWRKSKDWTFDSKTLSHRKGDQSVSVGDMVRVSIKSIDPIARTLKFSLSESD